MCLRVDADGVGDDGEGASVSVFLYLMKGAHDDKLQQSGYWPLRRTFTIKLLNQVSDKDHHSEKIVFNTHTLHDTNNIILYYSLIHLL